MSGGDVDRTVLVVRCADPMLLRVRPVDPRLAAVMGGFAPARYSLRTRAYDVPTELAEQFRTFARAHDLTIVDALPPPTARASVFDQVLQEQRERAAHADEQTRVNERGVALVRAALNRRRLAAGREQSQ